MTMDGNNRLSILYSLAFMWNVISVPIVAKADTQQTADPAAIQVAGLFMQTCVRFAGNKDGLRSFLAEKKVKVIEKAIADQFLKDGRAGIVFDTSNKFSKMALVSHDDGTCDAFSWSVDGDKAVLAVEGFLKTSNIQYELTEDQPDPRAPELRHRHYQSAFQHRKWLLVLTTSSAVNHFHVMFTALPRN